MKKYFPILTRILQVSIILYPSLKNYGLREKITPYLNFKINANTKQTILLHLQSLNMSKSEDDFDKIYNMLKNDSEIDILNYLDKIWLTLKESRSYV